MFDGDGLAVSLPARELAAATLPGSLFEAEILDQAPISADLRLAVRLVEAACRKRGGRMILVARPEIFVDPMTLGWLAERLGGIRQHLSISDGMAIRVLPGLRNHMFLYRPGIVRNAEAFRRLARRAPGFLATLASQVNSAHRFEPRQGCASPPALALLPDPSPDPPPAADPPRLLAFHLGAPPEAAAKWILEKGPVAPDWRRVERVVYAPLTEAALAEGGFRDALAAVAAAAYFDPTTILLLRPPALDSPGATLLDRLTEAATRLLTTRPRLPRAPAPRVFFVADEPHAATVRGIPAPVTLMMPDSFDFWRHPAAFYAAFAAIRVLVPRARRGERGPLLALLAEAFARRPELVWLKPDERER